MGNLPKVTEWFCNIQVKISNSVTSKECERMCKKTRGCGYSENAYFEMSKTAQVTRISRVKGWSWLYCSGQSFILLSHPAILVHKLSVLTPSGPISLSLSSSTVDSIRSWVSLDTFTSWTPSSCLLFFLHPALLPSPVGAMLAGHQQETTHSRLLNRGKDAFLSPASQVLLSSKATG